MTKDKSIKDLAALINKKFGKNTAITGVDFLFNENPIPTGIFALDLITGGGIPTSRITEAYGDFSSCKTLLCEQWLAEVQKKDGIAVYISTEDPLNVEFAQKVGLNLDELLYIQGLWLEEIYEIQQSVVKQAIKDDRYCGIVIDSVAQAESKEAAETENPTANTGLIKSRINSREMRIMAKLLPGSKVACLYINQLRDRPMVMYGPKQDTPGGRALKFAYSLRIFLKKGKKIMQGDDCIGQSGYIEITKSKVCPPHGKMEFEVTWENGIGPMSGLLELLVKKGYVERATGGWHTVNGNRFQSSIKDLNQGFIRFLEKDDKNVKWLQEEILTRRYL